MSLFLHAESQPDDTVIITVSGVVAYQTPDQIPGAVRAAIVRWAPQAVVLDIADVSLLDAGTIAGLLAGHQTGAWAGVPVTLRNVGGLPATQLRASGLAGLLCPQLAAEQDDTMTHELYAPSSPLSEPSGEPPAHELALHGAGGRRAGRR